MNRNETKYSMSDLKIVLSKLSNSRNTSHDDVNIFKNLLAFIIEDEAETLVRNQHVSDSVNTARKRLDSLETYKGTLDVSDIDELSDVDKKIERVQSEMLSASSSVKETTYPSEIIKRLHHFCIRFIEEDYDVESFSKFKTVRFETPDILEEENNVFIEGNTYSTSDLHHFVNYFTQASHQNLSKVQRLIKKIIQMLPSKDSYLLDLAKTDKTNATIDKFIQGVDAQAGKGAGAAYVLYPLVYDEMNRNRKSPLMKRHMIAGKRASTGKSMLGHLQKELFGPLATHMMKRPEKSSNGYDVDTQQWNNLVIDWPVVNIDDDSKTSVSQNDFFKNFYASKALKIGNARTPNWGTFHGFATMNVNTFIDELALPEIEKRVYIVYLTEPVFSFLTQEDIEEIYSLTTEDNRDELINWANANFEDAKNWLLNYQTPDIKEHLDYGGFGFEESLVDYLESDCIANVTDYITFKSVKEVHSQVSIKTIHTLTNGRYFVKKRRIGNASVNCVIRKAGVPTTAEVSQSDSRPFATGKYTNDAINIFVDGEQKENRSINHVLEEIETAISGNNKLSFKNKDEQTLTHHALTFELDNATSENYETVDSLEKALADNFDNDFFIVEDVNENTHIVMPTTESFEGSTYMDTFNPVNTFLNSIGIKTVGSLFNTDEYVPQRVKVRTTGVVETIDMIISDEGLSHTHVKHDAFNTHIYKDGSAIIPIDGGEIK